MSVLYKRYRHSAQMQDLFVDTIVKQMATDLQDTTLLARIANTDVIAMEAKYHLLCLVQIQNRHRSFLLQKRSDNSSVRDEQMSEARALTELMTYIEISAADNNYIFQLNDLYNLYVNRLHDQGIETEVNRTELKEKILENFPMAQQQRHGKNKVLVFEQAMQSMLTQALTTDCDEEVALLAKTAKMLGKDIFQLKGFNFDGAFPAKSQKNSVPGSLKMLISMILNGNDLQQQDF